MRLTVRARRPSRPVRRSPHGGPARTAEGVPCPPRRGAHLPPVPAAGPEHGDTPRALGRTGPATAVPAPARDLATWIPGPRRAPVPFAPAAPASSAAGPVALTSGAAGPARTHTAVRTPARRPQPRAGRVVTPPAGTTPEGGERQPPPEPAPRR